MDWMDSIWAALALVLIFEGLLPLLAPGQWRQMFIQLLPEYLSYFKADFHPSEIDYTKIVNYWKERLVEDYQLESFEQELKSV